MSFDGNWEIRIKSPMGEQKARLELRTEGDRVTGTASAAGERAELQEPVLEGDRLRWSQAITKPMALTLQFDLTRDGDRLSGQAKAGFFMSMEVEGERV